MARTSQQPTPTPAVPRVVELLRVSGQGQADRDTPEDQRRSLDRLRVTHPCIVVERIDSGAIKAVSGGADLNDRPDLKRLAELARAKAFDELRVRHLDRATRHDDPRERFAIYGMVQDAGAIIRDGSGHVIDPRTEIGEVDYFLQTWMAAKERRRIGERTIEARDRLSAQGRPMTTIPYGRTWDKKTGQWGLDSMTADIHRRMFRDVLAGVSLHQLARNLNDEGLAAPKGGAWEASSLRRMIYGRPAIGHITSFGHAISCPAIVDEQTWRAAQAMLQRNRTRSGPPAVHKALLRKLVTCSECGCSMHVAPGGKRGREALYYVCSRNKKRTAEAGCRTYHRVDDVDAAFVRALQAYLDDPGRVAAAREADEVDPAADAAQETAEARDDLAELDRREENLVRLHTRGTVSEHIYERQATEIGRLRVAAEGRARAAKLRVDAARRQNESAADLAAVVAEVRRKMTGATFEMWRRLVESWFPREPGCWLKLTPDGSVKTHGLVVLNVEQPGGSTPDSGGPSGVNPGTGTSASPQIPITPISLIVQSFRSRRSRRAVSRER
jgi:DNA invertase Pin-like site-specific DNA recombinase